jgi:hypothetical protein
LAAADLLKLWLPAALQWPGPYKKAGLPDLLAKKQVVSLTGFKKKSPAFPPGFSISCWPVRSG